MADLRNHATYVAKCTYIGAGSLASPVYDSRLSLLPWTLSHVWVIQHAMSPLTKLRLCYVMGCGLCSTTSACDAPHGKRLSGSCPVASCFCAACFRMYACCCNTHAHMCTHTHASGSHVCMDRGPCGFGTTQFMCIYVPCLNSRRLNTTCSCEATVCVCRSGARLLYCKTCKHATTKHQHNNIEQQQVQTRSNKKNLNIIEPKKL